MEGAGGSGEDIQTLEAKLDDWKPPPPAQPRPAGEASRVP